MKRLNQKIVLLVIAFWLIAVFVFFPGVASGNHGGILDKTFWYLRLAPVVQMELCERETSICTKVPEQMLETFLAERLKNFGFVVDENLKQRELDAGLGTGFLPENIETPEKKDPTEQEL